MPTTLGSSRRNIIVFSPPLDVLLIFTLTAPVVGWFSQKVRLKSLCGIYAVIGLAASGYESYKLFANAFPEPELIPLKAGPV